MRKHYINCRTGEDTPSATQAMVWHRAGDLVQVNTFYNEPKKTGLASVVHVTGAARKERNAEEENRDHCKRIALEVEAYADGRVFRCRECGEDHHLPEDVGDKYRCPTCGTVQELDSMEHLGLYDYMTDILDITYHVSSRKEYQSCEILVAWGGPNIYINTETAEVNLYWWSDRASYPLSYEARDAIDEWAEEMYLCS